MVKRFQHESSRGLFDRPQAVPFDRPRSAASTRRSSHRAADQDGSDSDVVQPSRPRLRRGRTEQPPSRHREMSKPGLLSDGDRSYAANASRLPSVHGRRSMGGPAVDYFSRPSRSKPPTAPSTPPRSGRTSPERQPSAGPSRIGGIDKPRMSGKGRIGRPLDVPSGRTSPGLMRTAARRNFGTSRVTSIARHFDRLSQEADKQRARRNAFARSKRARPVLATKVTVQVFDNVRDAFRDESDCDSSEADNEEDELGSDDSVDSTTARRKSSSPVKSGKKTPLKVPSEEPTASLEVPVQPSLSTDTVSSEGIPISASGSSMNAASILSDGRSEMSFTDRLQIELPTFETSAPLPSVPATPQLSADAGTADESNKELSQMGQLSESEMSSGGGERSSILKTLTGLWAFRAGEYSPLEYPL